jgi:para-aminobenzoate synthetase/4-amino-4-deoxychorismate lyase
VTGAPKISTMELIAELEASPREVYCGALGIIEPGGNATFNVPIRTVWIERATNRAVYGSGAGITFDSDATAEYAEVQAKAAVLLEAWPDFDLLETVRAENQRIVRLERHVARVLASARYFDIPAREQAIRDEFARVAAGISDPCIVRLLIDQQGELRAEVKSIDVVRMPRVGVARTPISANDRFLFHKTTHRREYNERLAQHPECWDVLLWNEHGEVTEFTRGNVVVEIDGELLTPALRCGLLAGTFRAELLEAGRIRETVVRIDDLARASRIWLINSVREWVEVQPDLPFLCASDPD